MDHPFFMTLTRSGPVGQSILAGLLILSIYTWAIIVAKARSLSRAEKECRAFLARFREGGAEWILRGRVPAPGPLAVLFESGLAEFSAQRELVVPGQPLDAQATARLEAALEVEAADSITALEKGHVILAIGASVSPFAGLFGTVWGIMNAFRSMSLEGSAGIAAVAPGVAEALVTTVAGLAVAIPAVVAYNLLNRRVRVIIGLIDRFQVEFLRAAHYACRMAGGAAAKQASREPFFSRRNS
ncbi:MAG: MotA/TolQ/ExbB proton channel family protein [bacterium]